MRSLGFVHEQDPRCSEASPLILAEVLLQRGGGGQGMCGWKGEGRRSKGLPWQALAGDEGWEQKGGLDRR